MHVEREESITELYIERGDWKFFQEEDGIRDHCVSGVQTCALPILTHDAPDAQRLEERFDRLGGEMAAELLESDGAPGDNADVGACPLVAAAGVGDVAEPDGLRCN